MRDSSKIKLYNISYISLNSLTFEKNNIPYNNVAKIYQVMHLTFLAI